MEFDCPDAIVLQTVSNAGHHIVRIRDVWQYVARDHDISVAMHLRDMTRNVETEKLRQRRDSRRFRNARKVLRRIDAEHAMSVFAKAL